MRGRPRSAGSVVCGPCSIRAYGAFPECGQSHLLPGPSIGTQGPICATCAGIAYDFHCTRCGNEGEFHRRVICARCALHDDLTDVLLDGAADPNAMTTLVSALCKAKRPESIFIWKRSPKVRALLKALASGATPLTHDGLDNHDGGREVDHLRAVLVQSDLLRPRCPYPARFEQWITAKLEPLPAEVAQPVEQFATWHHLRRIRTIRAAASSLHAPVHAAKEVITETGQVPQLALGHPPPNRRPVHAGRCRRVAGCRPDNANSDSDLHRVRQEGPPQHRARGAAPALRGQPITDSGPASCLARRTPHRTSESLPYRVAGTLLLLDAQPLLKVAALPTSAVTVTDRTVTITLGRHAAPVPDRSRHSSASTCRDARTCGPAPPPTRGSYPAHAPDTICTPTR